MFTKLRGKQSDRQKLLQLAPSFGEAYVGLRAYLGDGIYLLENGDLGKVYRLPAVCDEILTEAELYGAFQPLSKWISGLIRGLPSHRNDGSTVIQLICSQRLALTPECGNTREPNAAAELIAKETGHLFSAGLIKRDFYLTIRWRPKYEKGWWRLLQKTLQGAWRNAGAADRAFLEALHEKRDFFARELELKAIEAGLELAPVSAEELVSCINSILNSGRPVPFKLADDDLMPLWSNIVNPELKGSPKGFEGQDSNLRLFTFAELPTVFALGRFRQFIDILPLKAWDMVWTLSHGTHDAGAEHTIKKMFYAQGPSHRRKFDDLVAFEEHLSSANPCMKMSLRLLAYNVSEETESRILSAAVDYLGVPILCEAQIAPHLIASALPLNSSREDHHIVGRFRSVLLDRAICFAPFYTSASFDQGQRWWAARNGEPVKLDLFAGGGNTHVCVLGNSESGKSCLIAQFGLEFLGRFSSGVIRIIDRKTSYRKLCDLFGGKVIEFNEAFLKENPYSPFAYDTWDEDDLQNTVVFLQNSMIQLNPEAIMTGLHTEILSEAIKLAVNDHEKNKLHRALEEIDPHPTWIDVKKKLPVAAESKGSNQGLVLQALDDLRRWTVSFDPTGQFGYLLCRHEREGEQSEGAQVLVYDLDGIVDPRLQIIASQLAFIKISRDLRKIDRKERKLIIFEELGVLVQGDSPQAGDLATRFIRNVVKTARKIGAQAIGISNELTDFTRTEAGRTFWKVAPQKLFLPLSQSGRQEVREDLGRELTAADIDIIADLHIKKGFYSQAYLMSQNTGFRGSFLIPLSPLMNAVVTTNNREEGRYRELCATGLTSMQAIETLARDHPYGENL